MNPPYRMVRCPFFIVANPTFTAFHSYFAQGVGFVSVAKPPPTPIVPSLLRPWARLLTFHSHIQGLAHPLLKPTFTHSPQSILTYHVVLRTPTLLPVMFPCSQPFLLHQRHSVTFSAFTASASLVGFLLWPWVSVLHGEVRGLQENPSRASK